MVLFFKKGLLACFLCWCGAAFAGDPPQTPFLRIEAGGHTGAVAALATDAAGSILATAGYDKTVRIWRLPEGRQIEVLRPPIGGAQEGEIYAVAVSPDGKRVFAGGATGGSWDGTFSVYVFDVGKAALSGLLTGLPSPVEALAVSPDGARFAAGLAQGGVKVWDAGTGKLLFADTAYGGPVRALVFDRGGRLFTTCADRRIRVYAAGGQSAGSVVLPGLGHPWGIALSPDQALVAVADAAADRAGRLHVSVLGARSLKPVFTPDTSGLKGEGLLGVAWVHDGRGGVQLVAGGYAHDGGRYVLRRWADFGLGAASDVSVGGDTVRGLVGLPNGGAAFASEDRGWGVLSADGAQVHVPAPVLADLRPARERLLVSGDGQIVSFETGKGTFRFDAVERSLVSEEHADPALSGARVSAPGMVLSDWRDSNGPRLNEARLTLDRSEFSRSATITPDGMFALLGTDTNLRLFDARGRQVAVAAIPAAAWAMAASADGSVMVAALLDGTLRWYQLGGADPLRERAALFADPAAVRWVLFTPEGFFDDSARGGNELVGLHLNRARNQQPVWLSFSQAYRTLYAPAIVSARLRGDRAPAQAGMAALGDLRTRLTQEPSVDVRALCLAAADGGCTAVKEGAALPGSARLQLRVGLQDRGSGVGPVDLFVNGRNVGRTTATALAGGQAEVKLEVPLDPGRNLVQLRVYDAAGRIFTESRQIELGQEDAAPRAHRLFVLAVGIDHFALPDLTLRYAVADAHSFAGMMRRAGAGVFSAVEATELTGSQATRAGILAALAQLAGKVTADDTFLLYAATHGVKSEQTGRFLLIPQDIGSLGTWDAIDSAAIDETTLIAALARIDAQDAIPLLDTCHSGQLTADNLANIGHETGRYLLAAAGSDQEALDSYDDRNGVFVYALHEALAGRAAHDDAGTISALSLGEYVSRRVGELARRKGGAQDAVFRAARGDLAGFPVGRVIGADPH